MRSYAETALLHAQARYQVVLDWSEQSLTRVDQILDQQRLGGEPAEQNSVALCYGCWLGEIAIARWDGAWVGCHEPLPPRIVVAGRPCSPVDAVAARLRDSRQPTLVQLWGKLEQWHRQQTRAIQQAAAQNSAAWDVLATDQRFTIPHDAFAELPTTEDARAAIDPWLHELFETNAKLLLLAAGGGTHSVLHAVAGFEVTVLDISPAMLARDTQLACQLGLPIHVRQGALSDLSMFPTGGFDVVVQPVSSCYLPDLAAMYGQVAGVLRPGGIYTVQHKQPASLQATGSPAGKYQLTKPMFFALPVSRDSDQDQQLEPDTIEFIHPLETLLGDLCRSGFVIEDVAEPLRADAWALRGSAGERACFLPPYLRVKARRR